MFSTLIAYDKVGAAERIHEGVLEFLDVRNATAREPDAVTIGTLLNLEQSSGSCDPWDQAQLEANLGEYHYYLPLIQAVKYLRFWKANETQISFIIGDGAYQTRLAAFHPMIVRSLAAEPVHYESVESDEENEEPSCIA